MKTIYIVWWKNEYNSTMKVWADVHGNPKVWMYDPTEELKHLGIEYQVGRYVLDESKGS
jgi:hypothetical protein